MEDAPLVIAGLVLAAGSGSRFGPGPPKVLARLGDKTLLELAIGPLRAAGLRPLVVVVGFAGDQVVAGATLGDATVVPNPRHAEGQSTSLVAGLAAVSDDPSVEAVVVAMGDHPGVTPAVIEALVATYQRELRPICVPTYRGQRGNPVLLARPVFTVVARLNGDVGARAIMERHPRWVAEVPADGLADPRDVDTQDDLRALASQGSHPGREQA